MALLNNKQAIHIAAEVVVLTGLTFYFSSKNRRLLEHVEDLAQKLEDQEDKIQKLERIVNNMGNALQNKIIPALNNNIVRSPKKTRAPLPKPAESKKAHRVNISENPKKELPIKIELDDEEEEEEDSDLDAEIQEELEELDSEETGLGHLKKQ